MPKHAQTDPPHTQAYPVMPMGQAKQMFSIDFRALLGRPHTSREQDMQQTTHGV